ncbi:MAG: response regulator [Verrucomicrobiales bacterium]|nr:response regulator [Verrucomicrobiales bacterium]
MITVSKTYSDAEPPEEVPATEPARILVVDDEATMQILASTILQKLGHQAETVGSGEEAVEKYREYYEKGMPFSAVVMDLALPGGISGLEATIAIKQIHPDAKVIVSSGYLEQQARGAALEHGFAGMLPKPYSAERLGSELRWVLKTQKEA